MSSFTESGLVKKLLELNPSQQSIQTLSLWLIHHRKHHSIIVKTWIKELQKAAASKKLTFMYLANDVIQNSKKKGPEFGKEYENVLLKAFKNIAQSGPEEKTIHNLNRILNIWAERGVYDEARIKEFSGALNQREKSPALPSKNGEEKKRKTEAEPDETSKKKVKSSSSASSDKKPKSETIEVNGKVETHVTLSPHQPDGEAPEPEELLKIIQDLENSASSDAVVRERIANLPPEVSELSALAKLEDKEAAMRLAMKVNDAIKILNDYNARLASEMDERKKLTTMLKDFQREQQELLAQAEQRLQEYQTKLSKIKDVQREVRNHMNNLPDLTALPDVTGGLAPLPSAGDLFNIHH
ncbi:regulation of nuclear pre-mRNA domain-containing protein 1B [Toxorhynchites rutilus septentrionalis]|uniref:regulation of nuclear pre-mRNA domain-containing protein 1B n=1 Tax=Toxorhynchites rutilus septentrionalis TaxID=329112 RepID=UPI002478B046|nr:regulation of nuclear pre-mRNA domain-containing protein 1B [Toxorhynchites rutilus septentrionalis]